MIATAAAVGAVATGTFTALVPSPAAGTAPTAAADESSLGTTAATAATANLAFTTNAAPALTQAATATLLPVATFNTGGDDLAAVDDHLARLDKAASLAEKLAAEHAKQAEDARLAELVRRGGVDGWISQALQILDMPESYAPGLKKIIMAESGGNPRAVNNWDSNARRGTPSRGLMQTIPSTFKHYVHPEVANRPITDPVANITAGVRYMVDNYGANTLQAGGRKGRTGGYVGY